MQTLEINFKSVFENLPGMNLLLLPDPPFFTVVEITDTFCHQSSILRSEAVGKPVADIIRGLSYDIAGPAINALQESLETLLVHKQPYQCKIDVRGNRDICLGISHTPVRGKADDITCIITSVEITSPCVPLHAPTGGDYVNLSEIIDQAPVAMGILRGKDMVVETANSHLLHLWGKSENIIGLPVLEAIPEIRDQPFPKLLNEVYESGIEYHGIEHEAHLRRNGSLEKLYFNFTYAPLKNRQNKVTGIIAVASDVSHLVRSQKALEGSERRYRELIANAPVATAIYMGKDMEIRLANDAMLKLWGKDKSVIGMPLQQAVPELEGQPFLTLLKDVYKTGKTYYSTEDRADLVVSGQLQTFWFNFSYQALRDINGEVYGILNMAVDVSDIVRARNEINDSEARLRLAIDSAELGTWDFYPLTNEMICSPRIKELYGVLKDEPLSFEAMLNAVRIRDRKRVSDIIANAMKQREHKRFSMEYEVLGIDDYKPRWQRVTGIAFYNDEGVAWRLMGTVLDITERKRIEEALEERVQERTIELMNANNELERSNRELEQYAYVASHDLQEPLRKILVYTDLLVSSEACSEADRGKLEKIMSSAQRMSSLIKDLLNFSRLLKTDDTFSPVDINVVIRNVVNDFELKIQETNAVINMTQLPMVMASARQMNQLFYNLINNALKFTRPGVSPVINIEAAVLNETEILQNKDLNPAKSYVDISIADNGIGFNMKYVKQIFEIFKRLHTSVNFQGTGIGLALCRKIVLNHQGDIYAESKEGNGSIFHVVLPLSVMPDALT